MDDGKIILEGKVAEIKNDFKENKFEVGFEGDLDISMLNGNVELIDQSAEKLVFKLKEGYGSNQFLETLIKKGVIVTSFNEILPSLKCVQTNLYLQ